jgi:hypothetical protein
LHRHPPFLSRATASPPLHCPPSLPIKAASGDVLKTGFLTFGFLRCLRNVRAGWFKKDSDNELPPSKFLCFNIWSGIIVLCFMGTGTALGKLNYLIACKTEANKPWLFSGALATIAGGLMSPLLARDVKGAWDDSTSLSPSSRFSVITFATPTALYQHSVTTKAKPPTQLRSRFINVIDPDDIVPSEVCQAQ